MMVWIPKQGKDRNQPGQYPNQPSQYGGPTPPPSNDPYGAQQGGYQQVGQQPPYQQPPVYGQGQQQYGGYQKPYGSAGTPLGPHPLVLLTTVASRFHSVS